jgi:hypothetical protein
MRSLTSATTAPFQRTQGAVKWVQVDLGKSVQVERIVLKPCYDDFGKIGGGFRLPRAFQDRGQR